ncbi:MAG: sirohydrochlorin cobaltochelatase [Planctomycetaceae bacterium]|nr:sirohydrochlorin cobaltochelatase [Planctomycetaceae bacterium]
MNRMLVCAAMLAVLGSALQVAAAYDRPDRKPAIVLAAFGTTEVGAVKSILNIKNRVEAAFPDYDVRLAFTSNIIRGIWHERARDAAFQAENPGIPAEVYCVGNVLSTLARLQEDGGRLILVQSLHVTDGEEYNDLASLVATLGGYKTAKAARQPFPWIGVGEPALGVGDGQDAYLNRAAQALTPLMDKAKSANAALVLMAHGNEHLNQAVFGKLETTLRKHYPATSIGTVEAAPLGEDVVEALRADADAPRRVLLAPMMVVAGDHTLNDMAGDDDDSWASLFRAAGFEVDCHLEGLGSNDNWADIYIEHLKALEMQVQAQKSADEGK